MSRSDSDSSSGKGEMSSAGSQLYVQTDPALFCIEPTEAKNSTGGAILPRFNYCPTWAGGNGKTYSVLMDVGYRQVVYNAHSNKLCRGVAEKYGDKVVHVAPFDHILHGDYTELALAIRRKASVMLFDEVHVSTYTHRVIRTCIEFCAKYGIKPCFYLGPNANGYQTQVAKASSEVLTCCI
jgi:hypothetical protein